MLELQRPSSQVNDAFQSHFYNRHKKTQFPTLVGFSADLYDDDFRQDLVALTSRRDDDRLTTFLRNRFPKLFRRQRESGSSVAYLSENRLGVFVGTVNVLMAASMLFGAIYNLYYVKNQENRLGLIAGYTIAFAFCIGLLTNARRSEIFGACAAYAAVLVVFVSGNLAGWRDLSRESLGLLWLSWEGALSTVCPSREHHIYAVIGAVQTSRPSEHL